MTNTHGRLLAFTLLVLTLTYGVFQARNLIHGPTLTISSPRPGETVTSVLLNVRGKTENVTHVSINGQPITMDITGAFSENLITPSGYGVILVEATNRFGRHREERIEFNGNPTQPSTDEVEEPENTELSRNY